MKSTGRPRGEAGHARGNWSTTKWSQQGALDGRASRRRIFIARFFFVPLLFFLLLPLTLLLLLFHLLILTPRPLPAKFCVSRFYLIPFVRDFLLCVCVPVCVCVCVF